MKYIETKGLYCGYSEIMRISDFYDYYPEFFRGFCILITSLDSNQTPGKSNALINYFDKKGWKYKVLGNSILFHDTDVLELFKKPSLFVHFDEVYLLENYNLKELNFNKCFTPILSFFSEEVPEDFLKIFKEVGAKIFLSDGSGLNFACESIDILRNIEKIEKQILTSNFGKK